MAPAPPAELKYDSIQSIPKIVAELRATFLSGKTRDIGFRRHQLQQLSYLINDNAEAIIAAVQKDLGRCRFETTSAEVMSTTNSILDALANLDKWAKPENIWAGAVWAAHNPTVRKEPKGTVLCLGAWNYPISVQVGPIVGAIAAGCTFVLKPSEVAAHSAKLLAELWPKYMDLSASRIVNGAIPETTALLDQRWEHIFYTGNGTVGRIVAEKAAKWLCPVTLELGGKSPVFIDESANLSIAARRLLWAKAMNCGQTCIAPDYVLCSRSVQDKLVVELQAAYKEFWPGGIEKSEDYGRIINERQWKRLDGMLTNTRGTVVVGGQKDEADRFMAVTFVKDAKFDDPLMGGEVFGPLSAIIPVESTQEAINFVNANDQPLSLYVFGNDKVTEQILSQTRSGGAVQGDLIFQYVVDQLPFGGTGPSGYGSYHGKAGFDTYSHMRGVVHAPATGVLGWVVEKLMGARYPPYTSFNLSMFRALAGKNPNFKRPPLEYKAQPEPLIATSTILSVLLLAVSVYAAKDTQLLRSLQSQIQNLRA